jgi:putative SOS response-associated peptidase YedK
VTAVDFRARSGHSFPMCNRYANQITYRQYVEEFSETRLPVVFPRPEAAPNLEPRTNIFPTENAPVLLPVEGGLALRELRWGLIPWLHKKTVKEWKPLTTNARSETIAATPSFKSAFARRRCLIPVSSFYEWTGEKGHKTKWDIRVTDREWFCFAGIWDKAETADGEIQSYALVTMAPEPHFEPYHNRQPLILERDEYTAWLESPKPATALFRRSKPAVLTVEQAAL